MKGRWWAGAVAAIVLVLTPAATGARAAYDVYGPEWHAGGRLITFWSGTRLWIMNADGSGRRLLERDSDGATSLSPDGRTLAEVFEISDTRAALSLRKPGGHLLKRLVFPAPNVDGPAGTPVWSPDGRTVAWEMDTEPGEQIYVSNLFDRVRLLSRSHSPRDVAVTWAPDNRQLAFVLDIGEGRLATMASDGTHRKTLVRRPPVEWNNSQPVWSPDGRAIAFAEIRGLEGQPTPARYAIHVVRADGTGLRRLAVTPKLQGLSSLAWSPDSSQVIWSDTRGVMSVAVRTGSVRRLTYLRGEFEDVAWAPSWRILFSNSGRLYSLVPGGRPVRLF